MSTHRGKGGRRIVYCRQCGRRITVNDRFCTNCGAEHSSGVSLNPHPSPQLDSVTRQQPEKILYMSRGCSERMVLYETVSFSIFLGLCGLYLLFSFPAPREVLLVMFVNLVDSDYMSYHSYSDPVDPSDEILFRVFAVVLAGLSTVLWIRRRQLLQNSEIKVFSQHCEIVALPSAFVFMPLRSISLTGHQIQTIRSTRSGRFTIRTSDGRTIRFFTTDEHSCIEALNTMMATCYNARTARLE